MMVACAEKWEGNMAEVKEALIERLRKEVGDLRGAYQHELLAKIADTYLALQAIDLVEKEGGPLGRNPTITVI